MKKLYPHFVHEYQLIDRGRVIACERKANLIPEQGRNYLMGLFAGGSVVPIFYTSIFAGNYTPQDTDVAATFPGVAGETAAYVAATRPAWVPGAVAGGSVNNSASPADFTMNNGSPIIIYGDFLIATATKGGTVGPLLSVVRYVTPQTVLSGNIWRAIITLELFSA